MAPTTRSASTKSASSTSPLVQRLKTELKKNNSTTKATSKLPEAATSFMKAAARTVSSSKVVESRASATSFTRKRKNVEDEAEEEVVRPAAKKRGAITDNKDTKRKREEDIKEVNEEHSAIEEPVREIKKMRKTVATVDKKINETKAKKSTNARSAKNAKKSITKASTISNADSDEEETVASSNMKKCAQGKAAKATQLVVKKPIKASTEVSIAPAATSSAAISLEAIRNLPDLYEVEDDYNTDDTLSDFGDDDIPCTVRITTCDAQGRLVTCTNGTSYEFEDENEEAYESESEDTDEDDGAFVAPASAKPAQKKPSNVTVSELNDDEDDIPCISSEGVQREEAGLPALEEEDVEERRPIKAEITNYGNGRVTQYVSYEEQKKVTKEEMSKMSKIEREKAELNNYFLQFVENQHKAHMKEAMKTYVPGKTKKVATAAIAAR